MITKSLAESILNLIKPNITKIKVKINTNPVTVLEATATVGGISDDSNNKYVFFNVDGDFDVTNYQQNSIVEYSLWSDSAVYVWNTVSYSLSDKAQVRVRVQVRAGYENYS